MYGLRNSELVYCNSVIKRVKQCCCTLISLPKSTLNANLTTTNRFFTNDDWQRERFENFESDHQYESNLESDVRFEIESNHEASQVPTNTSTNELLGTRRTPAHQSVSDVAYRQRLRSASSHEVSVPRHRLSTYGRRAFAVAGPPDCLELFAREHAGSGSF